jgi:hypothetical protein
MPTKTKSDFEAEARAAIEDIIVQIGKQAASPAKLGRQVSASLHTTGSVWSRDVQTLNDNELKSVYALLAYVSHNENIRQETVQAIVEANFGVNHIEKLQHKDYEDVIRFLVDLRIDEMRN